jgi:ABC-type nitrate/sulfonate/bicarbonate transport system substrate-binding protein
VKPLTVLALSVLLLVACTAAPAASPTPAARSMHFMAGYKPQANLPFVGVYLAQAWGYFAAQGLEVQITHSAGQGEHFKLLLQGTVDVTTAVGESVLLRRQEDLPVANIALLGQRGDRAYAVLADSEIRSPRDWEGRTVGYKVYPAPDYLAMLTANGLDRGRIQEVPVGFDPRLLAARKVDVYPVFESNEPYILEQLGAPVRLFRPTEYGVPSLGLGYLTRQELVDKDPDLLQRFLKATLRGVEQARQDPEAAVDVIMQFAPNEDRGHQLAMLRVELEMADGPVSRANGIGWSTREQWQALHDSLLAHGGLKTPVDVGTASTNRILERVYKDGKLVWP